MVEVWQGPLDGQVIDFQDEDPPPMMDYPFKVAEDRIRFSTYQLICLELSGKMRFRYILYDVQDKPVLAK